MFRLVDREGARARRYEVEFEGRTSTPPQNAVCRHVGEEGRIPHFGKLVLRPAQRQLEAISKKQENCISTFWKAASSPHATFYRGRGVGASIRLFSSATRKRST